VRAYEKELVRVLRERESVDSYELLDLLRIDPKDSEMVKVVLQAASRAAGLWSC